MADAHFPARWTAETMTDLFDDVAASKGSAETLTAKIEEIDSTTQAVSEDVDALEASQTAQDDLIEASMQIIRISTGAGKFSFIIKKQEGVTDNLRIPIKLVLGTQISGDSPIELAFNVYTGAMALSAIATAFYKSTQYGNSTKPQIFYTSDGTDCNVTISMAGQSAMYGTGWIEFPKFMNAYFYIDRNGTDVSGDVSATALDVYAPAMVKL